MSKRTRILFARSHNGDCPVLGCESEPPENAFLDDGDLREWVEDDQKERLDDLQPGFYVWSGYFLFETQVNEWHVETKAIEPATHKDFDDSLFPLPRGAR